jgi:tetratricopeptide (TPR) repeat protein
MFDVPGYRPTGIRHPASGILLFILTLLFSFSLIASPESDFADANRLYEQGRFSEAAEAFQRMTAAGKANATVWFNLGNARYQAGQIGRAVAAYSKAQALAPRDQEIAGNLRLARLKAGTRQDESIATLLGRFTLNTWAVLAGLAVFVWFLLRVLVELRPARRSGLRTALLGTGLLALLFCAATAVVAYDQIGTHRVVVAVPEAVVRRGPLAESQNVFTPPDGTEMEVLDVKDAWLKVRDADGQEGWLLKAQVLTLTGGATDYGVSLK